jgi:hypothetical protein
VVKHHRRTTTILACALAVASMALTIGVTSASAASASWSAIGTTWSGTLSVKKGTGTPINCTILTPWKGDRVGVASQMWFLYNQPAPDTADCVGTASDFGICPLATASTA